MAIIQIKRLINADAPLYTEVLSGQMFGGEENAHQFIISAKRDGEIVPMSGNVFATFINPDGDKVELTGSMTDNGEATVTLDHDCYAVTGRFELTIFVTGESDNTAVYSCRGTVRKTDSETIIDPTHIVPNVENIIAKYGQMEVAVEQAQAAADTALNAAYSIFDTNIAAFVADGSANILNATTLTPGSKVNPTSGGRSNDATACRTGYTSYIGPVMLSVDTTEYKWCVWIYTNKSTASKVTSLTNNDYSTGPVVIPKLTGTDPCFQIGFINLAGDTVTAEMAAALETKMAFTKLVDGSLTETGAPADAKEVGDRLDELEDQIAEAAASTEPYKCVQRIANASPTLTGSISSMTVIDGKLFVFKYATGNEDVTGCKKYTINPDGTLDTTNTGTFSSNLGHANTVDWNAGNGCLISTRTPQTGDVTPESKIYIIPNVTGETTSFDRTATGVVGIDIDNTITVGTEQVFGEYRVNAVWAFDNVMKNDMVYVISDDSSSTTSGLRRLALLQLGKGTNQMQYGTLISGAESTEFNGTYNVLGVWTQAWQRVSGISQGDNDMQFWGGKLYEMAAPTGANGFPMMIHEITEWGTEWETRRILIPMRPGSGSSSSSTWEKEGIAIYKHHMYLGAHSAGLWVYEF